VSRGGASRGQSPVSFYVSEPRFSFDDVILTEKEKGEIDRFLVLAEKGDIIFDNWGLSKVIKHYNKSINLYGDSGTGKTITAHAIARRLNKKIVLVNYSEIESKFVGETSKNLVSLFKFAGEVDAVILFDEADALLSKRVTAMFSATDVSVNQTRNVLLKILDEYSGIIIFTTNFFGNFDNAFMRRIFTHVKYELPDYNTRVRLWNHYLVDKLPIENREEVIKCVSAIDNISGSDISTAVLLASIDAVISDEKKISREIIMKVLEKIKCTKEAVIEKYEVTTRKVPEEYALKKLRGEE